MRETLRDKIRQWYILGIAICLILGGGFLASLDSRQSATLTVASVAQALPPSRSAFTEFDRNVAEPNASAAAPSAVLSGPPTAQIADAGAESLRLRSSSQRLRMMLMK